MNTEGNTYIIYDKYTEGDNSYNNVNTSDISLEKLFSTDAETIEGSEAIKIYNSYVSSEHKISENLNYNFYKVVLFKLKINDKTTKNNIVKLVDASVLVFGINHKQLHDKINDIPNKDFLIKACSCHNSYHKYTVTGNKFNTIDERKRHLVTLADTSNTDRTDPIIENPTFTKINLFDYQRRTVKWMYDKEKTTPLISYSFNDEIYFGDYVFDIIRKDFISVKNRKNITFNGGLLADEVGLGKTFQTIALSLLNPPQNISYFNPTIKRLQSRATLIICPNQLCNQWIREITKTIKDDYKVIAIPMMTKVHFDKYTYLDILDADFVIVSYNFLGNNAYYSKWLLGSSNNSAKRAATFLTNLTDLNYVSGIIDMNYETIAESPKKLFDKNPILNCINFHRIVCDEFHEIYTVDKYSYLQKIMKLFSGTYKWCVTGTPFNKGDCVENMLEYVSNYKVSDTSKIITNPTIYDYITKSFFRRNTKKSIRAEYKLEPYDEKIILMKLSQTERAIYSAYLANPNVNRFSVLVRQLCNDPRLADEIKLNISGCKTPEDIEKMMVKHYQTEAANYLEKLEILKYRMKKCQRKITCTEYKRCRKYLKQQDNKIKVRIEYPPKIYDAKYEKKLQDEIIDNDNDNENNNDTSDDEDDDDDDSNGKIVIVNNTTYNDLSKKIQTLLNKNHSLTLNNLFKLLEDYKLKINKADKEYQGKRGTCEFFTNMLQKLNKLKKTDDDSDSDDDDDDKDNCAICLNEITGEDVGVARCGHLFCYQCIGQYVIKNPKCPTCSKPTSAAEIFKISYEVAKPTDNKDTKDKMALVNKIGTKLANLVIFLKTSNGKSIVFSQWDDMLRRTGEVLTAHGIKNVYCKGNVWSRDKAIREFSFQDDVKVIMLSSESAAAGTNLTAAENVILLDAIYKDDNTDVGGGIGSYEYRRNMEWQAIGRAYRMGQTKKVNVVRFIMKDTVEEEIYKINKEEDKKFKDNVDLIDKMIEITDDKIDADKDVIEKMTKTAEAYKSKVDSKKQIKKQKILIDSDDSDVDSLSSVSSDSEDD
jgi:SNF2 family DNA or RNA helicase